MKLDDKNFICVLLEAFFTTIQFLSEVCLYNKFKFKMLITHLKSELL